MEAATPPTSPKRNSVRTPQKRPREDRRRNELSSSATRLFEDVSQHRVDPRETSGTPSGEHRTKASPARNLRHENLRLLVCAKQHAAKTLESNPKESLDSFRDRRWQRERVKGRARAKALENTARSMDRNPDTYLKVVFLFNILLSPPPV
jgi:hypothetical protein